MLPATVPVGLLAPKPYSQVSLYVIFNAAGKLQSLPYSTARARHSLMFDRNKNPACRPERIYIYNTYTSNRLSMSAVESTAT